MEKYESSPESIIDLSVDFCRTLLELRSSFSDPSCLSSPEVTSLLGRLDDCDITRLVWDSEKKAFWINVYNGLVSYLLIKLRVRHSVIYHLRFFSRRAIKICGFWWSLDQIEHGMLRQNRKRYHTLRRALSDRDIRNTFTVKLFDPRIHFVLNCGAASCPVVRWFTADSIDTQLEEAERSFTSTELKIDHTNRLVRASKIFKWYRHDFSGRYIAHHIRSTYRIRYHRYDWRRR